MLLIQDCRNFTLGRLYNLDRCRYRISRPHCFLSDDTSVLYHPSPSEDKELPTELEIIEEWKIDLNKLTFKMQYFQSARFAMHQRKKTWWNTLITKEYEVFLYESILLIWSKCGRWRWMLKIQEPTPFSLVDLRPPHLTIRVHDDLAAFLGYFTRSHAYIFSAPKNVDQSPAYGSWEPTSSSRSSFLGYSRLRSDNVELLASTSSHRHFHGTLIDGRSSPTSCQIGYLDFRGQEWLLDGHSRLTRHCADKILLNCHSTKTSLHHILSLSLWIAQLTSPENVQLPRWTTRLSCSKRRERPKCQIRPSYFKWYYNAIEGKQSRLKESPVGIHDTRVGVIPWHLSRG